MAVTSATPLDFEAAQLTEPASAAGDPLLDCIEYVARYFGLPFSRSGALAGLPVRGPQLTADLAERAAEKAGLRAQVNQLKIKEIPGVVFPVVAFMRDGDACVILKREGKDRLLVAEPGRSKEPVWVPRAEFERHYYGYVMFLTPADKMQARPGAKEPTHSKHWFWSTVFRFWTSWIQIFFAAFIVNLLGLAVPLFTMMVYDRVIPNMTIPTLWALAIGVIIALFFDATLRQLRAVVLDITGRRVDLHISSLLFEHALALNMSGRTGPSGALASQIREFEAVRDFFTSASIIAMTDLLFMGVFIFVLWNLVGIIVFVPITAVILVLLVTLLIQIPLARSVRLSQQHGSRRHSVLIESLVGIESVKAANAEGIMQRKWEDSVAASARASSSARMWSSFATYFTGLMQQAVSVGMIITGVFLVRDGQLTIGGLIAANLLAGRLMSPLGNIAMTLSRAQQAFTAMHGINELMALPREGVQGRMSAPVRRGGGIEFRHVDFQYPGQGRPTLEDISFKVAPGEKVAVIGRIGSGKSTVGKLAAGFFEAERGSIQVGGTDTRALDISDLRATVAYVPQEPELFSGTIRENILMGRPYATAEELEVAVRISGVDAFAGGHPLGLNMPVGERGKGLSGGQRQAVALARMLLRDPEVLFLDEPSSSMDSATEERLVAQLSGWAGPNRTIIVCTHRGLFLNLVSRLIVLDGGKIVADGPRDQVLAMLNRNKAEAAKPQ
ncbi:MAG: type I secretion system permease/ATPase [Hyphomicrobiales bacterium]